MNISAKNRPGFNFSYLYFSGIQGDAIGDVKFNKDGDRIGRYSIYQYQYVDEDSAFKYVLVGEFGDFPALKIENDKETG